MTVITSPLGDAERKVAGDALQGALIDLLDLSLAAKQLHWNLVGSHFRSVHLQLDEVVTLARRYADVVAERAAALAVNPDGRSRTIAANTALPEVDPGWVADDHGVRRMAEMLRGIIARMRRRIEETAGPDPVTQDIFLDITRDLEKQAWMFEVQEAGAH